MIVSKEQYNRLRVRCNIIDSNEGDDLTQYVIEKNLHNKRLKYVYADYMRENFGRVKNKNNSAIAKDMTVTEPMVTTSTPLFGEEVDLSKIPRKDLRSIFLLNRMWGFEYNEIGFLFDISVWDVQAKIGLAMQYLNFKNKYSGRKKQKIK